MNPENGQMSGLASVTTASESRHDVSSPYSDYSTNPMDRILSPTINTGGLSPRMPLTSQPPYSPGARSDSAKRQSQMGDGFDMQSPTGEIPMQSFQDGQPPAPPIAHSWRRIDQWAEENYPELFDQICEGCTANDLNELEHTLDCSLPNDVRESLQHHDGQERGGLPTGIIFSCMLLDCEEIVQERENWLKVNAEYLSAAAAAAAAAARAAPPSLKNVEGFGDDAAAAASGSARSSIDNGEGSSRAASIHSNGGSANGGNSAWRQELQARQQSVPAGAIQRVYAHPAWIPLVRDWGGNNLAVDLAPGPRGQWGQIIMCGRDYDTKYVVAKSWAHFLAVVADDLSSGKWYIDEESYELRLREFKTTRVEPRYFDILRWRMDQKYNRRANNRRSNAPSIGPNGAKSPTAMGSPYASPMEPHAADRGRPLQRLSINSPLASPSRPGYSGKPSPLARVTEETSLPELNLVLPTPEESETLVDIATPRATAPPASKLSTVAILEESAEEEAEAQAATTNKTTTPTTTTTKTTTTTTTTTATNGSANANADGTTATEPENDENTPPKSSKSAGKAKQATVETEIEDAMKTIEI